jgi:hypothetical protein
LIYQRGDLGPVWERLREWYDNNRTRGAVRFEDLYGELSQRQQLNPIDLTEALDAMFRKGLISRYFQVKGPGGRLVGLYYRQPSDIPPYLSDADGTRFAISEAEVVTGFSWPADRSGATEAPAVSGRVPGESLYAGT